MAFLKYAIVASSLLGPILAQDIQPLPQITTGANGNECGGCYVVADVAAVAFGSEVLIQTYTAAVDISNGKNGSYTTTRIISGVVEAGTVSLSTQGQFGGNLPPFTLDGTTVNVGGVVLTSPTAYQVFTAFSVTSSFKDEKGNCITSSGLPQTASPAFQTIIPANPDANYILAAESSFIKYIGLSCSAGGQSDSSVIIAPISTTTTTSTSVRSIGAFTPQPPPTQAPIATGSGNFTTYTGASISPYVPGGAGATLSVSFSQSTLPLMAVAAVSILIAACAL